MEKQLQADHAKLLVQLGELEKQAIDLGAKPAAATGNSDPFRVAEDFEPRQKKLAADYKALIERLAKTTPGSLLTTTLPGADIEKATLTMVTKDGLVARRLLSIAR